MTTLTAATTNEIDQAAHDAANAASRERFARHCTLAILENGAGEVMAARRRFAGTPNAVWAADVERTEAKFKKALREANDRFEGMTESKKYAKAAAEAAELGIEF